MLSAEYAAGFFDGEGCVNITVSGQKHALALRVMITNTDIAILAIFKAQFGGYLAGGRRFKPHWKKFRQLTMSGHAAANFLRTVEPFVRVKRSQVQLALEFWELKQLPKSQRCFYTPRTHGATARVRPSVLRAEDRFKQQLHELNRKGHRRAS